MKKMKENWYNRIEEPLKGLIKLLRNNGFNTTCSCGHFPHPYIEMDWYEDSEFTKLYNLLIENGYKNFIIRGNWNTVDKWKHSIINSRHLEIQFYFKLPLAKLSDIQEGVE